MENESIHEQVTAQFGANAAAYATSPTHRDEKSLRELVDLVKPKHSDRLLDVATGAGHTALAFAPEVAAVVAYDITPAMLHQTEKLAQERGLENVVTQLGSAEEMPFEDGSFDVVTVRTAPHHFADIDAFLAESFRVLKSGGTLLVVDTTVPEDPQVGAEINRIEKLRDPSHGRNLTVPEWVSAIESNGFQVVSTKEGFHAGGKKMELDQWMNRIGTPEENREEIIGSFTDPTPELVEALDIERLDGSIWFTLPEVTLLAKK
jgi:ubiquinone/menaquinone biosynthesis C-methylase UbiE